MSLILEVDILNFDFTSLYNLYDVIIIDPPWNQGKTSLRKVRPNQQQFLDYTVLSKNNLKNLPIDKLGKENSYLFLWVTNSKDRNTKEPIIKIGFELLECWEYKYYTMLTWNKKTGVCPFGHFQITTEHVLFGYRSKYKPNPSKLGKYKTIFTETPKQHSRKPDCFYEMVNNLFEGRKLDLFGRYVRKGFDCINNIIIKKE